MKLSTQHATSGLSGHIRSVQTGEMAHFQFARGTTKIPFEVQLGDKRLEVYLRIEAVPTDSSADDLDLELLLRAPDVAATPALDYVPKVAPPTNGGKIDQDGAAMSPPAEPEAVVIQEGPPVEVREAVFSEAEREENPITPTELAIQQAEEVEADLFTGEDQVGTDGTSNDEHPATRVPALPGVGMDRRPKRGRR
jgi:hypothetical protein